MRNITIHASPRTSPPFLLGPPKEKSFPGSILSVSFFLLSFLLLPYPPLGTMDDFGLHRKALARSWDELSKKSKFPVIIGPVFPRWSTRHDDHPLDRLT
ncbi:hypothetical protein SODALDRAFT_377609 [Sodiomyces alkalinus F11]|uniref:Uncharacterized protein n=1 Tax=Sodiomyces alkalinus (strain CBS 110278 / VKM F-3762 / F11) TaxID=1314773 RepID=A0A3N2PYS0_SODAK|nr:hypothetical protein SODALDRAFT_377609 [Sodiomyces alkalinus F11]ROT39683.1 hypothetical protein SODALDRAFT_377609 [Sodiomyces alkalinus F11]